MKLCRFFLAASFVLILSISLKTAHAQFYWDINGATAGATDDGGGLAAGTWDGVTSNWTTDATGASSTVGWTAGQTAVFSAGTNASGNYTVSVSGTQAVGGVTFQEGTVTLTGGQLDLTGTGSPADYNGDGIVSAADYVAWRKLPLLFGGDPEGYNAWRTDFGASGGVGGTITTATGTTQTISSVISGSVPLTKAGADRLLLTGANIYTGGTKVNVGTLQFGNTTAMPASGGVTVTDGATLSVNAGGVGEWTNAASGGGSIGGLIAGTGGQGLANQVAWTAGSNLGIDTTNAAGATLTYNNVIGGFRTTGVPTNAVGLTKRGAGTLELGGANTYTGATTMATNSGVIKAIATNTLPSATVLTLPGSNGNARVELYDSSSVYYNQTIAGLEGGGSGTTSPSIVDVGKATLTIDVPASQAYVYNGYLKTDFTSPVDRGKVVKTGPGDLTLGGLNNENAIGLGFGGEFSMEAGRLIYTNNVGTGSNSATRPSQLTLKGGTLVKNLATPGTSMSVTPRTLEIGGSFTMDMNGSTGNAQILPSAPGGGLGGINLTAVNPTITVMGAVVQPNASTALPYTPTFILSGIISDGGAGRGFTKAGPGLLTLDRVNAYSGTTTVAEGPLRVTAAVGGGGAPSTIGNGNSPVVLSGGSLEYTGAPINGVRVMPINNPVTMVASSGVGHTTGSGAGNIGPTVDMLFSDFTATAGTLTLYNNGSSNEPNFADPYSNPLEFRVGFTGTGFDFAQPVVVTNHTNVLVPNRTTSLMSSNTSGSHEFSGVISGNGGYVRNGAGGTSILSGNNTYTGDTKVLAGILSITNPYLADTADVYLLTGTTLDLDTAGATDAIDQLFIDGVSQGPGTYGFGATNPGGLFTGSGFLLVTSAGSGGAVPEPGTFAMAMVLVLALASANRRRG